MEGKTFPVRRKTSNGSKVCSFANCKSSGRNLPKDTDISFIPFAKPCTKYRNEEIEFLLNKKTGEREHVPSECSQCSRAQLWINLSQRKDYRLRKLTDISMGLYVCSQHFVEENVTRDSMVDPLPANVSSEEIMRQRSLRKEAETKLAPINGVITPVINTWIITEKITANAPVVELIPMEHVEPVLSAEQDLVITEVKSLAIRNGSCNTSELQHSEMNKFAEGTTQTFNTDFSSQMPETDSIMAFAQKKMTSGWACIVKEKHASFIQYDGNTHSCLLEVRVFHTLPELSCETFVLGQTLPVESEVLVEQRKVKTYQNLQDFMWLLEKLDKCKGITKKEFVEEFYKIKNQTIATFCYRTNTVRAMNCNLFSRGSKCMQCWKYENRLKAVIRKRMKPVVTTEPKMSSNNRFLSREQLLAKMKVCERTNKALKTKLKRLNLKVERFENEENREMMKFFARAKEDIDSGSPFGIFLSEQMKAANRKSCRGYKWSPEIIKWCMSIYKKSTTAYKAIRAGGYIILPSVKTIRAFNTILKQNPGYFDNLPEHAQSMELNNLPEHVQSMEQELCVEYLHPVECEKCDEPTQTEEYILPDGLVYLEEHILASEPAQSEEATVQ